MHTSLHTTALDGFAAIVFPNSDASGHNRKTVAWNKIKKGYSFFGNAYTYPNYFMLGSLNDISMEQSW